jgi:hypothetical protein
VELLFLVRFASKWKGPFKDSEMSKTVLLFCDWKNGSIDRGDSGALGYKTDHVR